LKTSEVNRWLQCWDAHDLFVLCANVFPHNRAHQPTGLAGALALRAADVIRNRYPKNPGLLESG